MKSKNSLAAKLIAGGVLTGFASYLVSRYTYNFYLQLLPLLIYPVLILLIFSRHLRHTVPPNQGSSFLFLSQLATYYSLFLLLLFAPSGASKTMDLSMIALISLALIGIGFVVSLILRVFIYYKVHNENNMHQPLHQ